MIEESKKGRLWMEAIRLNAKQELAVALVMEGKSDGEIAERVGVTRQCVSRWRNQETDFILALQQRREQMREKHMDALGELVALAIGEVRRALTQGDEATRQRIAMGLLRMSGLQAFAKPGKAPTREELEKEGFLEGLGEALRQLGFRDEKRGIPAGKNRLEKPHACLLEPSRKTQHDIIEN